MFYFFYNLCLSIQNGTWSTLSNSYIDDLIRGSVNNYLQLLGSMFTDTYVPIEPSNVLLSTTVCTILSLIACIGFYFIIIKAFKKLFTCFLDF